MPPCVKVANEKRIAYLPRLTCNAGEITEAVQHEVDKLIFRLANEHPLYTWYLAQEIEKAHVMRLWTLREQGYIELDRLLHVRKRSSRRARSVESYLGAVDEYGKNVLAILHRLRSRALDFVYSTFGTMPTGPQEHQATVEESL